MTAERVVGLLLLWLIVPAAVLIVLRLVLAPWLASRRSRLISEHDNMVFALGLAAAQFTMYARHHREKGAEDKALVNERYGVLCYRAARGEPVDPDA